MSYRTRILAIFVAVALATNAISLTLMYRLSRSNLFSGYQDKIEAVASSVAAMLDADALKSIQSRADEPSPAYVQLKATLRKTLDANQNEDTNLKRIFTVTRAPQDAMVLLIGVDPEDKLQHATHPGDVYRAVGAPAIDISKMGVDQSYIHDEFGTSLRAWAPVRDRLGQATGAVIVQASNDWVESKLAPAFESAALGLLVAVALTIPAAFFISRRATRPVIELSRAIEAIGKGDLETRVELRSADEFGRMAAAVNQMAVGLGERDRVKSAFARYVSIQVMEKILTSGKSVHLSGDRRRISVLFCDIRGFSTLSENMRPEKVVELLNEYFERMVDVVFRNHGTLDKFMGDGMMVIFGAPEDDPYQEEHALKTAIEMRGELRILAEKWQRDGIRIEIGIGINTGPAVVGNIGSSKRMEYTAIGDTVNLASRLESATKELGVGILVSEYTYHAVRGTFQFKPMGSVQVRGRVEPVLTYSLEDEPA